MSEVTFTPFQRVLARDSANEKWHADMYSHMHLGMYVCIGHSWRKCIPYEGNEYLLGITNSPTPPEPEFKFGDKVAISYDGKDWLRAIYIRKVDGDMPHEVLMQVPWHYGGQEYHVKFCCHADW